MFSSSYHSPIVAEKESEYAKTKEPIYSFLRLKEANQFRDREPSAPEESSLARPETGTLTSSLDVPGLASVITVVFTLILSSKRLTPTVVG